jgi:DNA-binding transcriptional MerR regulator
VSVAWSLEELAQESHRYLDDGDSRRVQWKPNGRQIRYYATLGLLDKPETTNGKTVWYGPKHLLQLLAIKRLQQEGLKLAEVQRALMGATTEQMRLLAGLPENFLGDLANSVKKAPSPRRESAFWAQQPTEFSLTRQPPAATFNNVLSLEIAPGLNLTLDEKQVGRLSDRERDLLARAFCDVWRAHQEKTKENP